MLCVIISSSIKHICELQGAKISSDRSLHLRDEQAHLLYGKYRDLDGLHHPRSSTDVDVGVQLRSGLE